MPADPGPRGDLTAPLGAATDGSLRFAGSIAQVTLTADPELPHLFRARCLDAEPLVSVDGGTVTLGSHDDPGRGWRCRTLTVTLSAAIPWDIRFEQAASGVTADLARLRLTSLEVGGSASHVEVALPPPEGEVALRVLGDASDLTITRPPGVAVRLTADRGARYLALDDRYADATGSGEAWQTPGFQATADRYALTLTGPARAVTVTTARERP